MGAGALQILSEVDSLVQEKEIGQRWKVLETREGCGTNGMPICVGHPDTHVLGPVISTGMLSGGEILYSKDRGSSLEISQRWGCTQQRPEPV